VRALKHGYAVKAHREGNGVGKYRYHVELMTYSGPAGGRVPQRTGEHAGLEEALGALLQGLEGEMDEKLHVCKGTDSESYAESVDIDLLPVNEPDAIELDTPPAYNTPKPSARGEWEREQDLQENYADPSCLREPYAEPEPSSTRSVVDEARFDPCYVTNDYPQDQDDEEPVQPVLPLQYKPYRKPQPLHQDRNLPYRLPEQEDVEYRPYRKDR
jgi:hypothetical protein